MSQSWNQGDLAGYMEGYWKSPELIFSSPGSVSKGWDEAFERYKQSYQSGGREMGKLNLKIKLIEILDEDPKTAKVEGNWALTFSSGQQSDGSFRLRLIKLDEPIGWKIAEDHSM